MTEPLVFAHLADLHIGAWREQKFNTLTIDAFNKAIDFCLARHVAFILFSGDLFNTALPNIDHLKQVIIKLKECKAQNVPVYCIPGSHDFSPSGKTMLDILDEAELLTNVVKGSVQDGKLKLSFTIDKKTGVKITGMIGKRGALEKHYYEDLDRAALEEEPGKKIFMFHSAITELKPAELAQMDSAPISFLPKGFDYYAGGHVHIVKDTTLPGYRNVVYPGPLFPATFRELETLKQGSFCIVEDWKLHRIPHKIKNVTALTIDAEGKDPAGVEQDIRERLSTIDPTDAIILLRIEGTLHSGSPADIPFSNIIHELIQKGAYHVAKNTVKLTSKAFEAITVTSKSAGEVEEQVLTEHKGSFGNLSTVGLTKEDEISLAKSLLHALSEDQHEGEKKYEYEDRVKTTAQELIKQTLRKPQQSRKPS